MCPKRAPVEQYKRSAGEHAADLVKDGMVVGLGTGSTVYYTILKLARRIEREDLNIVGIPTSVGTERLAKRLKIPLASLEECPVIDLTIDGADEVDPDLDLIKGAGGALLREKIVAANSRREIIVVTEEKLVDQLGDGAPLSVEVVPFGHRRTKERLAALGRICTLRTTGANGDCFFTDSNNLIYDLQTGPIEDPAALEKEINNIPGVVENGLFLDVTEEVVVGSEGGIRVIDKDE